MKIQYEEKNFSPKTVETIEQAERIIEEYSAQGFQLTLRQLYYQFVARDLIPNTERSYKRLGSIVSDARRAGMIDWDSIEDRTRFLRALSHWDDPRDILRSALHSYRRDLWENQKVRIEVWIEKDALIGVIEEVCNRNDVPFFSCRGYVSDSEMHSAADRIKNHESQKTIILHLGDHDPSGIDMTRDIRDRIELFTEGAYDFEVRRIALSMEQVREFNPPPNPAKVTDSRFASYEAIYGDESWELDALEPSFMLGLVKENIDLERDVDLWNEAKERQERERGKIDDVIDNWEEDS